MKMNTLIGTCGFAESHRDKFKDFGIVEVQQSFYQPPRIETAVRWRTEASDHFVFMAGQPIIITTGTIMRSYQRCMTC